MLGGWTSNSALKLALSVIMLILFCVLSSGCRELETIQREV